MGLGGVKGYYKLFLWGGKVKGQRAPVGLTDAPRSQASANASRGQGRKDLTKIVSFSAEQALS